MKADVRLRVPTNQDQDDIRGDIKTRSSELRAQSLICFHTSSDNLGRTTHEADMN